MTPIEFLTARYDEREDALSQVASQFAVRVHIADRWPTLTSVDMLRTDIALKRKILTLHSGRPPHHVDPCDAHAANFETIHCDTTLALTAEFDNHPDFDPEWAI